MGFSLRLPLRPILWATTISLFGCTGAVMAADASTSPSAPGPVDAQTRYVWAKNLIVRASSDSKGQEVAKLPFGAAVELDASSDAPVAHRESILKLVGSENTPAGEVVIDGHWQHIHAAQGSGWVFDGFLSRYAAPTANSDGSPIPDAELELAKHVFGVKLEQAWKDGDSKKSPAFAAMRKHTGTKDKEISSDLEWVYVEFQPKGSYEQFQSRPGDVLENTVGFKDIPMTFNEAILWVRYFDDWSATDPKTHALLTKYSGKVQAGRVKIKPSDDTVGVATNRIVECKADTCNLVFQLSD